jgi:hypothetical protein
MVFENNYSEILANKFLNFKNSQSLRDEAEIMCSDGEKLSVYSFFSALIWYVVNELIPISESISKEELDLYRYLEEVRQKYSVYEEGTPEREFDGALCVSFLEGMLNVASHGEGIYERFIPYLGDKCKEFCKAWDQFTGVRSPGLWFDEEWAKSPKGKDSVG